MINWDQLLLGQLDSHSRFLRKGEREKAKRRQCHWLLNLQQPACHYIHHVTCLVDRNQMAYLILSSNNPKETKDASSFLILNAGCALPFPVSYHLTDHICYYPMTHYSNGWKIKISEATSCLLPVSQLAQCMHFFLLSIFKARKSRLLVTQSLIQCCLNEELNESKQARKQ